MRKGCNLMTYKEVLQYSISITKRYGINYYRATTFFPHIIREAVFLYYAWMRIPDEYVDAKENQDNKSKLLNEWISDWDQTVLGTRDLKDIHWYMKKTFEKYAVPETYSKHFLQAMSQDLQQKEYTSYSELEKYMYGSAVVVGLSMLCFFGLHEEKRLSSARSLAKAMQMTNFLRDIQEDFEVLGRIYMPQDEMKKFGVSVDDIAKANNNENWKKFMQYQIVRCRDLYAKAWVGIEELPWKLKFPIRIATRKYEGILSEIEKAGYDVWLKKHSLSPFQKKLIISKSIFI